VQSASVFMSMVCLLTVMTNDEIRQLHDNPEFMDELTEGQRTSFDLDKAWAGIHWLLNGDNCGGNTPLFYLLSGGQEVNFVDPGYGPPHTLTSEEVVAWDDALSGISCDELAGRFDAKAMLAAEIYPEIWEDPESREYLLRRYDELKIFVAAGRKQNAGLLVYLT
jgi:Domain of unknown function (DUF1877)